MRRQLSTIGLAALVLSLSGCPFRKKQPSVPQQGQAPTLPAPAPTPPPLPPQPAEAQPVPPPEKTEVVLQKPQPKKKPSKKPPETSAQEQQKAQAAGGSAPTQTSKLIIQEGNPPNSQGQLSAGVGMEDASPRSKQTTEQLLQSAQTNLNSINRPLSPEEQAMVAQIKDYMAQSRKATADSDSVRAHNLALKARLLSDELVKR
ncbi:MAG TPA: hypothetical protein VEC95_09065 [Terriglobales bacterium]|nr:hypothetical protein [Terriglobales bacterium]